VGPGRFAPFGAGAGRALAQRQGCHEPPALHRSYGPGLLGPLDGVEEKIPEKALEEGVGVDGLATSTYLVDGAWTWRSARGQRGALRAGEFHLLAASERATFLGHGHLLRLFLRAGGSFAHKRFCRGERRGRLCQVASSDGANGSLALQAPITVFSTVLSRGHHVVHPLPPGHAAWVQLLAGQARLDDRRLVAGEGAARTLEAAVSLTAVEEAELVLVDVAPNALASPLGPITFT
jgi:hypothetical protein